MLRETKMHEGENKMCKGRNKGLRRVNKRQKSERGKPKGKREKTLQIVPRAKKCMRGKSKSEGRNGLLGLIIGTKRAKEENKGSRRKKSAASAQGEHRMHEGENKK